MYRFLLMVVYFTDFLLKIGHYKNAQMGQFPDEKGWEMLKKIVARVTVLGVLGLALLMGGFAVAGATAPEAKAWGGGCFGWNGIFVNVGWCNSYGYGGYGGYGFYPPPVYVPPPPPPPPVYPYGGCGCRY